VECAKFFRTVTAKVVQMFSPNKFSLYFIAVLILSAILLSTCSETSEYGEASDYEKLGADCLNTTGDTTAPIVSELSPSDNSTNVPVASKVVVTFSDAMLEHSVTTNTADTKCSGSLQLSSDDFSTCIKMADSPVASDNDTTFTVTPTSSLSLQTNYKIKITSSVLENSCNKLATDNTTVNGFTTARSGSGTIKGMVFDDSTGDPLSGVNVQFYGTTIDNTTSFDNGSFNTQVDIGNYIIKYSKTGFANQSRQSPLETDGQTLVVPSVRMLPTSGANACASTGNISGKITDVTSESIAIAGADLILRVGTDETSNTVIATGTTDSSGNYSFSSIETGWYTVYASKAGYISSSFYPKSCGNVTFDYALTQELPNTESMRIVLQWQETTPVTGDDLDAHLQFDNSTNPFHLHWGVNVGGNQDQGGDYYVYDASDPSDNVTLDRDDKLGPPGTETITIINVRDGPYSYSVHDFTNADNASSTKLKKSGAYVTVYLGADLPGGCDAVCARYTVPPETGNLWRVFTYTKSGGLNEVKTMTSEDTYTDVY